MPLTRVEGDFSQVSNIVQITIPDEPEVTARIFVGFMSGETWLVESDLSAAEQSGFVDLGLGYVLGYSRNEDSSIVGAYGQALEGSSAGASRSTDFSFSWQFDGAPIYSSAATRQTRAASGAGRWIIVGTRTTGAPSGATSTDFGNDAFTWDSISFNLSDAIGNIGIAGIDFVNDQFYIYTNDGQIARSPDGDVWEVVASGGPSMTFSSSNTNPYARFAALGDTIVCLFAGRIVVSEDSGNTWDMASFINALGIEEELAGGAGFNNPVMFGLAAGNGAFIACGNDSNGSPFIKRSTVGAETPWEDVTISLGEISTYMFDVLFDDVANRFLVLAKTVEVEPAISGGEIDFDTNDAQGAGWSGSIAHGFSEITTNWSFVTGSEAGNVPELNFGDVAGYISMALIHTGELGGQTLFMMQVPEAELRPLPQSDYFDSMFIEGVELGVGPLFQDDATFNINFDSDRGVYELAWMWFDGQSFFDETNLTGTFSASLTFEGGGTTVNTYHVLQSIDAGVTFTDELQQLYEGPEPDKGWIMLLETPPPSFNLLQEDDFAILQEEDSHILVTDDDPPVDVPPVFDLQPVDITESMTWTEAIPATGVVTGYEVWRTTAQEFEGQINFSNPSEVTVNDLLTLLATVDANTFFYLDETANNLTAQYAYNVRAIGGFGFIDSNIAFSSAVS